ncbi:Lon protease -like protein 2, peroxisomal [Capsicum chinense]|nr:Lon protease -like protein 2, peroxisomal [Capsicum chinense]
MEPEPNDEQKLEETMSSRENSAESSPMHGFVPVYFDYPIQEKASLELELDLKAGKERLDTDHYGLVKVKQWIIEYLAVRKLKPNARGLVLYFVGPPGIGKTSLASSIIVALGRELYASP